jgi:diaminohydroxyphosphoribosylaminopyrimidine deaminase/5-amino-6-(5-phosphoribosylamino)uracil reductase
MTDDFALMQEAIALARRGWFSCDPNPRVGCVIADTDGQVLGRGWHERAGGPHAEVVALAEAGSRARGQVVFVSLEPCSHHGRTPPCADALVAAGVGRVVVAMQDPNPLVAGQGIARLRAAGIQVDTGLCEAEARSLNPGFISRMERGRPFVRVKMACSLDGRTAMASGESQWITGPEARADVQRLRAEASAIMTGVGTVLADDPALTVRPEEMLPGTALSFGVTQPLRVVLDTGLRTPENARLLHMPGRTLLVCAEDAPRVRDYPDTVEVVAAPWSAETGLDVDWVLKLLAERAVNLLHVETGAELAGALQAGDFVDEWVIYQAPVFMGSRARPLLNWAVDQMADVARLEITDLCRIGRDVRMCLRPGGK